MRLNLFHQQAYESADRGAGPARDSTVPDGSALDRTQWERVTEILAAVNGRWPVTVLRHLADGSSRPADLLAAVNAEPGKRLSRKMMFEVLHRLTGTGLISRVQVSAQPRQTRYLLTRAGREVLAELSKLGKVGSAGPAREIPDPPPVDVSTATSARMWSYWLGGKDHFTADREAARAVGDSTPLPAVVRSMRRFRNDTVRMLTERGVHQFLELGCGLPDADIIHEIAQQTAPESRVVYVDNDPLVMTHARALLVSGPLGALDCVNADVREPGEILRQAARTLNLAKPVAVLLVGILSLIPDNDDPWAVTAQLMDGISGDAYLVIAHAASDLKPTSSAAAAERYNRHTAVPIRTRPRADVARFLEGLQLLDPGLELFDPRLVSLAWKERADGDEIGRNDNLASYVGIGWRPARVADGT